MPNEQINNYIETEPKEECPTRGNYFCGCD